MFVIVMIVTNTVQLITFFLLRGKPLVCHILVSVSVTIFFWYTRVFLSLPILPDLFLDAKFCFSFNPLNFNGGPFFPKIQCFGEISVAFYRCC